MKTAFLSVPNWNDMQHYKDRAPPWIKLHNELLENYDFECLQDASKAHLICIWLLASRTNNKINADPKWIQRKIGAKSKVDIDELIDHGFLELNQPLPSEGQDASDPLAPCLPRGEGEGEGEGEQSKGEEEEEEDILSGKPNDAAEIIEYLNSKTETNYQPVESNTKFITARIQEGRTVEEIKAVIDRKCPEWPPGHSHRQYLRPKTIFAATNFNQYFGQLGQPLPEQINGTGKPTYQERAEERNRETFDLNADF